MPRESNVDPGVLQKHNPQVRIVAVEPGESAVLAGTSSGANVIAAIRTAQQLGPDSTVVTLMIDSGLKYMSTDVYAR